MLHITLTEDLSLSPHSLALPAHVSRAERTTADSSFLGGRNTVTVIDGFLPITGKQQCVRFLGCWFFFSLRTLLSVRSSPAFI